MSQSYLRSDEVKDLFGLLELTVSNQKSTEILIGSSGAFTSMAKMIASNLNEPEKLIHSTEYELNLLEFEKIKENIVQLTLDERRELPGLIKERAPMIVVGTMLVDYVLKKLQIQQFKLARYALKEGVANEFLNCFTH